MSRIRPARGAARLAVVAAIALVAVACMPPSAPKLGRPALRQPAAPPGVWDSSDPGVLAVGGKTYLFGSTNNVQLPVRELTSFTGTLDASRAQWGAAPRNALRQNPYWISPDRPEIWAPSPVKIRTRYFVFYAAHRRGATDRANDQCIGRAVATAPAGPYTAEASPVYCGLPAERGSNPWGRGALDPEVFRAPDGALYLLVAVSRTRDNIGVLRLTADGKVVGGINAQPTTLVSQRFGWHDGVDDAKLGATFLENPSMAYERATRSYLLFYSAGDWRTSRYLTGFARCATPTGPCTVDGRGPFLKAGSGRSGVGGLTAFRDPAGVLRVAYASWQAGSESAPSGDGSLSRHTTLARVVVSGTNPDTQTVALVPS
ncbi:MAG: family 43 glycosylhydrolase [Actinobacteria bacterium]|nr:family 43 glycosylhydrolase [Actinomycetota bacterium]